MTRKTNIKIKHIPNTVRRAKIWHLVVALAVVSGIILPRWRSTVQAESCPDVKIIFARGSGGEREVTDDYLSFKSTIEEKLTTTDIKYEFVDLDYPAVGVGIDNLDVTLGAFFSGGEAYEFGESVNVGVQNLMTLVNDASCPGTKYALGGYSQGAMVVSKALGSLRAERVIYAATFGDPKIYLPEGEGAIPAACRGENLSDYRMYVPDCQAYKGLLGAYIPYEPAAWTGKVGTWCNKRDILCSSHINIDDHMGYVSDNLYEDASRVIFDKIATEFGVEKRYRSPHDTAILIDSTGSMAGLIEKYKAEAQRLAEETLMGGGRVALYEYRDLKDPFAPVEHCGFEECNLEKFKNELAKIRVDGGGDEAESLLSASLHVMQEQNWKLGSTKSLVVLTDADYLMPDRDGVTLDDVVTLSKTIDPVNFYIITVDEMDEYYTELAHRTGGLVVTNLDELHLLTDYIIERYDSLPRAEEADELAERPILRVAGTTCGQDGMRVRFETDGDKVIIIADEMIVGVTDKTEITISKANNVWLMPIANDMKGGAVEVEINGCGGALIAPEPTDNNFIIPKLVVPKAPDTGKA